MHGSRLPVPPRQSAWSGSKENLGHYSGNNTVNSGKETEASQNDNKAVLSDTRGLATHQLHAGHRYPAHSQSQHHNHGPLPVHQTVSRPFFGQNPSSVIKKAVKQAGKVTAAAMHNTTTAVHKAPRNVVTSAQPALRTSSGFTPNSSFPLSYVGMPASTVGITIGPPKDRK